jgi:hypothetical protein
MSDDPIADLRRTLVRTARRRRRPWWRRRPTVLGGLAVLLVATPAAAGIDGLWRPDVPPVAPMRTVLATASDASPSCSMRGVRRGPTTVEVPPPAVLDVLGVLRGRATAADRAGWAAARRGVRPGIAVRHVRLLGVDASGDRQWIAPRLLAVDARPATARCPARRRVRHWTIATFSDGGSGGELDASALARQGTMGSSGTGDRKATVTGIVPDGVTTVAVSYDGSPARTWPVRRNFFSYSVGLPVERAIQADVVWKDAAGRVVPHEPLRGGR